MERRAMVGGRKREK
ncbi:hypothetical protein OIU79_016906, partial [Salix purpurea]